jgi:osmotically-inducible protein OsmY
MRYDRDNENFRRDQNTSNRRPNERYHQFGAEEDRSMRDSSRDYGRYRNYENSHMDDDFYREQDRGYESESRSGLGTDFNFGGRSSSYGRSRYFGDFSGSSYGSYESRGPYEHHSMWDSVKDFFGVGPKGYSRSDDRIREDVSEALTRDRAVDASEIEVTVKEGTVSLRGSVSDKWMKRRAEDCAEEISGVREVRNDLEVKREGSTTNMNYLGANKRTGSIGTGGPLGTDTSMNSGDSKNTSRSSKRRLS